MSGGLTPILYFDFFEEFGHLGGPAEFLGDAFAHGVAGDGFAVSDVDFFWLQGALLQPDQDFVVVAVGAHGIEVVDFSFHWPVFAVDLDGFDTAYECITTGTRRLEAGKYDAVTGIGQQGFQVVQHAATGGHATGGDNHAGVAHGVQLNGLLNGADKFSFFIHQFALGAVEFVFFVVLAEYLRGFYRHRAVQVHRQFRDLALPHEFVNYVQEHLGAAHRERGH